MANPADVDDYIAAADDEAQPALRELRELIVATVPDVDELIAWNVPIYRYHGELVGLSYSKKHVTFGFGLGVLSDELRGELEDAGYGLGKQTLRIRFDQDVPVEAVTKIIEAQVRANTEGDA